MFDAFLGKGYDPDKLELVSQLLDVIRTVNWFYTRLHNEGEISEDECMAKITEITALGFKAVERALGERDYVTLFGV